MKTISLFGIEGLPKIKEGDNLGQMILDNFTNFENGDIVVIAQKIISKAEGRVIDLSEIKPSEKAIELYNQTGRDPEFCEILLNQGKILKTIGRIIVVEMPNGIVCTSAGIDWSNVENGNNTKNIVLLPINSDKSAKQIREYLENKTGKKIAVIINDSLGNPNRKGSIGMAIGISGISALEKKDGVDFYGKASKPTVSLIDEISAGASIIMGQSDEGIPIVIARGIKYTRDINSEVKDAIEKVN